MTRWDRRRGEAGTGGGDVGEFDVVHDDEVVEMGDDGGELIAAGFDQDGVGLGEDEGVALMRPCALSRKL